MKRVKEATIDEAITYVLLTDIPEYVKTTIMDVLMMRVPKKPIPSGCFYCPSCNTSLFGKFGEKACCECGRLIEWKGVC